MTISRFLSSISLFKLKVFCFIGQKVSRGCPGPQSAQMAKKVPMRLRYLRVKSTAATGSEGAHAAQLKACEDELNTLMSCWRANGVDSAPCMAAVQALAMCSSAAVIENVVYGLIVIKTFFVGCSS